MEDEGFTDEDFDNLLCKINFSSSYYYNLIGSSIKLKFVVANAISE